MSSIMYNHVLLQQSPLFLQMGGISWAGFPWQGPSLFHTIRCILYNWGD